MSKKNGVTTLSKKEKNGHLRFVGNVLTLKRILTIYLKQTRKNTSTNTNYPL